MSPTTIDVNLTWLAPGRVGGSEEYLVRQLTGLFAAGVANDLEIRMFCQPTFPASHPELCGRVEVMTTPYRRDSRPLRIVAENSWLAAHTRGAHVVHHGGGTAPMIGPRSTLLTVHDLQYLEFPHYFSRARRSYLERLMPGSVRRARLIGVPSEFVRGTVIDAFDVAPDRVMVIPHGVPMVERPDDEAIVKARDRYGVGSDYVAIPAITHPHKGHRVLVDMLAATAAKDHPLRNLALVVIGGEGAAEAAFRQAVVAAGMTNRVVRTGRVPAADRDALVAGAVAVVFPSEYEGFGAPLVEAMDLGVPVVGSNHPAVTEVCGDAAVIVAERTGEAWARAIDEAVARSAELVAAGHLRRAAFTLARSGTALAAAYRSVAAESGPA
ncbi:MAG TPA: glycosyltransferase family 1 protein [Ilumatobacter sp.]|nr:glycosyltransferase family 1 protein [Ilumatobacter sp.]